LTSVSADAAAARCVRSAALVATVGIETSRLLGRYNPHELGRRIDVPHRDSDPLGRDIEIDCIAAV
jgi:hypothetical protein